MGQRVIEFHYKLSNGAGEMIDRSEKEPFAFIEGSKAIIAALERSLVMLQKGDKRKLEIPAKDAYGDRKDNLIITVPLEKLGGQAKVGDKFKGGSEDNAPVFKVTNVAGAEATLDANHPLAGEDLTFEVEIAEVREATPEELQHGHAHQAGGHQHH